MVSPFVEVPTRETFAALGTEVGELESRMDDVERRLDGTPPPGNGEPPPDGGGPPPDGGGDEVFHYEGQTLLQPVGVYTKGFIYGNSFLCWADQVTIEQRHGAEAWFLRKRLDFNVADEEDLSGVGIHEGHPNGIQIVSGMGSPAGGNVLQCLVESDHPKWKGNKGVRSELHFGDAYGPFGGDAFEQRIRWLWRIPLTAFNLPRNPLGFADDLIGFQHHGTNRENEPRQNSPIFGFRRPEMNSGTAMSWLVDRKMDGSRWGNWADKQRIAMPLDRWVQMEVHVRWSTGSDGFYIVQRQVLDA